MIPKIIHYCWFGNAPLPELAQKCIASWKIFFHDYEIIEWNETNYDVNKIKYSSEAYNAKKYAFVSDYARFDILYQYGGIYFDTDVEVIKPFDNILQNGGFMGFESTRTVNAGLGMGCNAGLGIIYQILQFYAILRFINTDSSYNLHTVVEYVTNILNKNGLKAENEIQKLEGLTIYPTDYFAPKSALTGELTITKNTYSIHHYDASWVPENERSYYELKRRFSLSFGRNLGIVFSFPYFVVLNIKNYGLKVGVRKILEKVKNAK
jgi:hypothetical protein